MIEPAGRPIEIREEILFLFQDALDDLGGGFPIQKTGFFRSPPSIPLENPRSNVARILDTVANNHVILL